jgi:hypothetical protein
MRMSSRYIDPSIDSLDELPTAANKFPYSTAADVWAEADITAAGRALLDDASAAAQLTTLTGVTVSAAGIALLDDANAAAQLTTLGVTAAAQTVLDDATVGAMFNTIAGVTVTAAGIALLDDANAAAQLVTLGTAALYQPLDSDLTTIAANITAAGHAILDDANAAAQLTTLGVSAFAQTVLDDADAATARATLGVTEATNLTGAAMAVLADVAVIGGIPVVHTFAIPAAASADYDITLTHKTEVLSVSFQKRAAAAGGVSLSVTVKNSTNAVTNAVNMNAAGDTDMFNASTIDDAFSVIAAGGTLRVTTAVVASDSAMLVTVLGVRRT